MANNCLFGQFQGHSIQEEEEEVMHNQPFSPYILVLPPPLPRPTCAEGRRSTLRSGRRRGCQHPLPCFSSIHLLSSLPSLSLSLSLSVQIYHMCRLAESKILWREKSDSVKRLKFQHLHPVFRSCTTIKACRVATLSSSFFGGGK